MEQPCARLQRLRGGDQERRRHAGRQRPGRGGLQTRDHRWLLARQAAGPAGRPRRRPRPFPQRDQGTRRLRPRQGPQTRAQPLGRHHRLLRRRSGRLQARGGRRGADRELGRRLPQIRLVLDPDRGLPRPERPADRPDALPADARRARRPGRVRDEQRGRQHRPVALGQAGRHHLAYQRRDLPAGRLLREHGDRLGEQHAAR
uniref:FunU15 n=1 Tax=Streptosporangium sp. KD35 TaxID=2162663 RepID=A0A2U9KD16_9ACTN|nr:FunU15 [Streptosporangium sp. KD35]